MAKSRPTSAPELVQALAYLHALAGPTFQFRVTLRPVGREGRVLAYVEAVHRYEDGRSRVAVRWGESTSLGSDAQILGAVFRSCVRARVWADNQGDELAKRVAWEAGRETPYEPRDRA